MYQSISLYNIYNQCTVNNNHLSTVQKKRRTKKYLWLGLAPLNQLT